MDTTSVFAPIVKSAPQSDGSLLVYGLVSDSSLDGDQQRCDPAWLGKALPEWFTIGNIREQHDPNRAVGKATEYEAKDDKHYITAKIVDPVAKAKTEAGIFTGFSIGVKDPRVVKSATAPGGLINDGRVIEVSIVDRPCNGNATLTLVKAATPDMIVAPEDFDAVRELVKVEEFHGTLSLGEAKKSAAFTPADMAKMVNKNPATQTSTNYTITAPSFTFTTTGNGDMTIERGVKYEGDLDKGAMAPLNPGGPQRYPINSVQDLKDAIHAFGRGKASDKDEIKAHIKSEAKRLGRSDLIPDTWKAVSADLAKADAETHDSGELRDILQGLVNCMKAELDELAGGEDELFDLSQLLTTISAFCCWWDHEAREGETASPYDSDDNQEAGVMTLAANPDQTKAAEPDAATDAAATDAEQTKTAQPDETKAATPETSEQSDTDRLADLVKSALADAMKPLTEQAAERDKALADKLATVEGDLAKVLALPEAGGPVITRSAAQAVAARDNDRTQLLAQADELLTKADRVSTFDKWMASGYRERARELQERAGA